MQTGDIRQTLEFRDPYLAKFSPDGKALAVSGNDGLIRIYDTTDFVERERLTGTSGLPSQLSFTPDGSHLVSARTGEVRTWDISATGPDALRNVQVSGGLIDRLVVAGDESAAYATVYSNSGDLSSVHRIDLRSGDDDDVLTDVKHYFSTRPLVSPDLSVVATLDQDFVSHVVALSADKSTQLGPCESVRAFDRNGRVAALDATLLCIERGQPTQGITSRIADLETGRTLLDLGSTSIYAAAFGHRQMMVSHGR